MEYIFDVEYLVDFLPKKLKVDFGDEGQAELMKYR